jgi:transcriptional regulator with XRE-family HTH domain
MERYAGINCYFSASVPLADSRLQIIASHGVEMKNKLSKEALSLRKLRELIGMNRKEAGIKLGVSFKAIEKFENGRAKLSPTRVSEILRGYNIPHEEFESILNGKIDELKKKYQPKQKKVIEHNQLRRSYQRLVTKDVLTLIALRKLRFLSQYQASKRCGYSKCAIGHIESGRIELPPERIEHVVKSYGFTIQDFNHHKNSDQFITDIQDECIKVIRLLSEEKLKAVFPLLKSFRS